MGVVAKLHSSGTFRGTKVTVRMSETFIVSCDKMVTSPRGAWVGLHEMYAETLYDRDAK